MREDWTLKYHNLRKQAERKLFNWRARAFDKQIKAIEDPSRLKAFFTTRRGAKSYCDGIYLYKEAFETDACNCLYLSLTRLSSKGIIWKDVLKDINSKDDLKVQFNSTELTATTPNGSVIYVSGIDVDEDERKKLFGRKYKLVVIDEAALIGINLYDLVYVVLKPAMTDMRGTIVLSGMASNITRGLFYDITNGKEPGWSLHQWGALDNPYVAIQWQEELDDIAKNRPLFMETPAFKQAYLNEWVIDEDAKVYKFNPQLNSAPRLPILDNPWHYVLGIDLGHSPDPSAFVVGCYHDLSPILYFEHAEKHLKMDVTDVANKIKELDIKYHFDVKVIDNANKQAVAELNNRHGVNVVGADKTGKADFINLMNADFIQAKIKILPGASNLTEEYETLVWETDNGKVKEPRKEHAGLPNHLTDGALYLWRYCYQYLFKPIENQPSPREQSVWEPKHMERLAEEIRKAQNPNELDVHFDEDIFDLSLDDQL